MKIIQRPFTDDDLTRIQTALAGWIQQAGDSGYCHIGEVPHRIYSADPNRPTAHERVQIWQHHGEIIGFANCLLFDNAFEVYTAPAQRGTDAERIMLQAAIDRTRALMRQVGKSNQQVITDVWQRDTTRQTLLNALGLGKYRVWTLRTARALSALPDTCKLPGGFHIRRATTDDINALNSAYDAAFGTNRNVDHFRKHVLSKPGHNITDHVLVNAPDGRVAAFTHIWFDHLNHVGLFEPVGTSPHFQRMGLARALMTHTLHLMAQAGMKSAQVNHTITNTAAYRLYYRLGFRGKHIIYGYTT